MLVCGLVGNNNCGVDKHVHENTAPPPRYTAALTVAFVDTCYSKYLLLGLLTDAR
jgi:hypothetical protein